MKFWSIVFPSGSEPGICQLLLCWYHQLWPVILLVTTIYASASDQRHVLSCSMECRTERISNLLTLADHAACQCYHRSLLC